MSEATEILQEFEEFLDDSGGQKLADFLLQCNNINGRMRPRRIFANLEPQNISFDVRVERAIQQPPSAATPKEHSITPRTHLSPAKRVPDTVENVAEGAFSPQPQQQLPPSTMLTNIKHGNTRSDLLRRISLKRSSRHCGRLSFSKQFTDITISSDNFSPPVVSTPNVITKSPINPGRNPSVSIRTTGSRLSNNNTHISIPEEDEQIMNNDNNNLVAETNDNKNKVEMCTTRNARQLESTDKTYTRSSRSRVLKPDLLSKPSDRPDNKNSSHTRVNKIIEEHSGIPERHTHHTTRSSQSRAKAHDPLSKGSVEPVENSSHSRSNKSIEDNSGILERHTHRTTRSSRSRAKEDDPLSKRSVEPNNNSSHSKSNESIEDNSGILERHTHRTTRSSRSRAKEDDPLSKASAGLDNNTSHSESIKSIEENNEIKNRSLSSKSNERESRNNSTDSNRTDNIEDNSGLPLNLATEETGRKRNDSKSNNYKAASEKIEKNEYALRKITLNKPPCTPINGEKFAVELKKQLKQLTRLQILDLRKRNSVGAIYCAARKSTNAEKETALSNQKQLENEIARELLVRDLQTDSESEPMESNPIENPLPIPISMDCEQQQQDVIQQYPLPAPLGFQDTIGRVASEGIVPTTQQNECPVFWTSISGTEFRELPAPPEFQDAIVRIASEEMESNIECSTPLMTTCIAKTTEAHALEIEECATDQSSLIYDTSEAVTFNGGKNNAKVDDLIQKQRKNSYLSMRKEICKKRSQNKKRSLYTRGQSFDEEIQGEPAEENFCTVPLSPRPNASVSKSPQKDTQNTVNSLPQSSTELLGVAVSEAEIIVSPSSSNRKHNNAENNEMALFKKPKTPPLLKRKMKPKRLTAKQRNAANQTTADSLSIDNGNNNNNSNDDNSNTNGTLRRSKRGHVPLKNNWSFHTNNPTPLYQVMYVNDILCHLDSKTKLKSAKSYSEMFTSFETIDLFSEMRKFENNATKTRRIRSTTKATATKPNNPLGDTSSATTVSGTPSSKRNYLHSDHLSASNVPSLVGNSGQKPITSTLATVQEENSEDEEQIRFVNTSTNRNNIEEERNERKNKPKSTRQRATKKTTTAIQKKTPRKTKLKIVSAQKSAERSTDQEMKNDEITHIPADSAVVNQSILEYSFVNLTSAPIAEFNRMFDGLKGASMHNKNSDDANDFPVSSTPATRNSVKESGKQTSERKVRIRLKRTKELLKDVSETQSKKESIHGKESSSATKSQFNTSPNNELVTWLKDMPELPMCLGIGPTFEEMHCSTAGTLEFQDLEGIDCAFYNTNVDQNYSLGYLRFKPKQKKPSRRSKSYNLHFVVLVGMFKIETTKDNGMFVPGDMIAIKKGMRYSIQNESDDIGVLMIIKK